MKKPTISIIIPCFNSEKHIKRCLNSILKSESLNYEIIVVDDLSQDKSRAILKRYRRFKKIKIFFLKKNLGPCGASNFGAKKAQGKYLLLLDIDTKMNPSCLAEIVKKFKQDKKIGALQTKIISGSSQNIETAGHFLTFFGFPYEIGVEERKNKHNQEKIIFGARNASMAIRKSLYSKIGGYDQDYFMHYEETDLSWRVWLAGYRIIYLPQAKIHHFQKSTLNEKTRYRLFYEGAKNSTLGLIKNAPLKILIWLLPLHTFGWLIVGLKSAWVYRGLAWNIFNFKKILQKRRQVAQYTQENNEASKFMFGPLGLEELAVKGWRWLNHV